MKQPPDYVETKEQNSFDPRLHLCAIAASLAFTGWCVAGLLIYLRF